MSGISKVGGGMPKVVSGASKAAARPKMNAPAPAPQAKVSSPTHGGKISVKA